MSNEITTIRELKIAVKAAKRVFIKPVFFGAETPVQITKIEANYFLGGYHDNLGAADLPTLRRRKEQTMTYLKDPVVLFCFLLLIAPGMWAVIATFGG